MKTFCETSHEGLIEAVLIENGALVDAKKNDGSTPLYIASQNGHLEIVKLLIKSKAQINENCVDGSTLIHIAVAKGHIEVVKYLEKVEIIQELFRFG